MRNSGLERNKEIRNTNFMEMDVCEINYNYYDEGIKDYQHFKASVIAKDARDAVKMIGDALPKGTKFNVESFDQRICTITGISDFMKKKIFDALKKEFDKPAKKGLFMGAKK